MLTRLLPLIVLLVWMVPPAHAQESTPRVLMDMAFVVYPGDAAGPQCLMLDGGALTVELQRTGDLGGGPAPVQFALRPFVVAPGLLDMAVPDSPTSTTVTISRGVYCYSLGQGQPWVDRPASAPRGQIVRLRLALAPAS